MTIKAATLNVGGTASFTGGTSTGLLYIGASGNQLNFILDDSSEFVMNKVHEYSITRPKAQASAPNGWTQRGNSIVIKHQLLLDNASYTTNTGRASIRTDPEATDAEVLALRLALAQSIADSAMDEFFNNQALD